MRAALPILMMVAATANASPRDFVGVKTCGSCHPNELAQWQTTAHARAADAAVLGARVKDGACLSCHGTGEGVSARNLLPGVQCEACHGGGAAYAKDDVMRDAPLARLLGLREDPLTTCARCHRASARTSPSVFDAKTAWPTIAHAAHATGGN